MVDVVTGLRLVAGVILLLANGFFVGIEFAMTRVRQFDESEFQGSRGLERAWEMTERLEIYLSGCQVGITISSVGLGFVAEPALAAVIHEPLAALGVVQSGGGHTILSVGIALAVINLLHVIIGEQAPTYFGVERTKTAAHYGAPLLYWWTRLMSPVIAVADWVAKWILRRFGVEMTRSWADEELEEGGSRAELRSQMGEILSQGGLPKERRDEVMNALTIGEKPVRDIMVDLEKVVALSTEDDIETNLELMREQPHVRFPLISGNFEEYHGVVYSPQVLRSLPELEAGEVTLEEICHEPMTMEVDTPVSEVIDRFQEAGEELALVVDDGEPVGLVTPTDAWEEITGELRDPLDEKTIAG